MKDMKVTHDDAVRILQAVTTTDSGVGRAVALEHVFEGLCHVLERDDCHDLLTWAEAARHDLSSRDVANLVFAASHALLRAVRRGEPERLGEAIERLDRAQRSIAEIIERPRLSASA